MSRVYLDWNATAPLRVEAREAMLAAMDVVGNPSSVHAEGRAAKAILERARAQVAGALGAQGADIVFTSGATEAAALAAGLFPNGLFGADIEHDCIRAHVTEPLDFVGPDGQLNLPMMQLSRGLAIGQGLAIQAANSETGLVQPVDHIIPELAGYGIGVLCDAVQAFGKRPVAFDWMGAQAAIVSAHKLGGPKGVGALVLKRGTDLQAQIRGGGQEMGRRHGTENLIGIAGFGAAAEAATQDLADGMWDNVDKLRNILEKTLEAAGNSTILVGKGESRLPNTSMFITEGWKGETQVMAMDLAGFAVSAGSACSSGKVRPSGVLRAMGYSEVQADCALRVSLGPTNTHAEVAAFCDAWLAARDRKFSR